MLGKQGSGRLSERDDHLVTNWDTLGKSAFRALYTQPVEEMQLLDQHLPRELWQQSAQSLGVCILFTSHRVWIWSAGGQQHLKAARSQLGFTGIQNSETPTADAWGVYQSANQLQPRGPSLAQAPSEALDLILCM